MRTGKIMEQKTDFNPSTLSYKIFTLKKEKTSLKSSI